MDECLRDVARWSLHSVRPASNVNRGITGPTRACLGIVQTVNGEWYYSKEFIGDDSPDWFTSERVVSNRNRLIHYNPIHSKRKQHACTCSQTQTRMLGWVGRLSHPQRCLLYSNNVADVTTFLVDLGWWVVSLPFLYHVNGNTTSTHICFI